MSGSKFWAGALSRRWESEKADEAVISSGRQHASALAKIAVEIHDETERLTRTAA